MAEADLPRELSLWHLWLDQFGHLKLLEFPAVAEPLEGGRDFVLPGAEWATLIRQVVVLGLTGEAVPAGRLERRAPGVPLPSRARRFVDRVMRENLGPERLKDLERENTRLKRLLADAHLDAAILREAAEGNF